MRTLLPLLAALALLAATPPAAADETLRCDVDDDLYNHCRVGPVHVVTGPLCAGARIGAPASCTGLDPA